MSKVWAASSVPLVVTGRGERVQVEKLANIIVKVADDVASADRLLAAVPGFLAVLRDDPNVKTFDLLIAAWSETAGPVLHYVGSDARITGGFEPFVLHNMGRECTGGPSPTIDELIAFAELPISDPAFFERHGADFMEAMRSKPSTVNPHFPEKGVGHYTIGGHCELTTITPAGATTKTLRVWDDKPGERINPFSADGSVVPLANYKPGGGATKAGARKVA